MNDRPIKRATKYEAERLWFGRNRTYLEKAYPGKWIAIQGEELIAVGDDAKQVADEARAQGINSPLIAGVRKKDWQGFYLIRRCL